MSNNPIFYILNHLAAPTLRDFTTVMTVTVTFPNHIVIWLVVEDQGSTEHKDKHRESRKQKSKKTTTKTYIVTSHCRLNSYVSHDLGNSIIDAGEIGRGDQNTQICSQLKFRKPHA